MKVRFSKVLGAVTACLALSFLVSCTDSEENEGVSSGTNQSAVETAEISFSPDGGIISKNKVIKISAADENAVLYYSTSEEELSEKNYRMAHTLNLKDGYLTIPEDLNEGDDFTVYALARNGKTLSELAKKDFTVKASVYPVKFSVESGTEVESGTKIKLTTLSEKAKIYYTTDGTKLTRQNAIQKGTEYKAEIEITENTTIYAIATDGEDYSKLTSASFTVPDLKPLYSDGEKVIMYCSNYVLGLETVSNSKYKLVGISATITNNNIELQDTMAVLTIETEKIKGTFYYRFKNSDGKYLTALGNTTASGTLKFDSIPTDSANDYTLFTITETSTDSNKFYITSKNATCKSKPAMIEYYQGFSSYKSGTGTAYEIQLFKVD